jgi:hypothetical protein
MSSLLCIMSAICGQFDAPPAPPLVRRGEVDIWNNCDGYYIAARLRRATPVPGAIQLRSESFPPGGAAAFAFESPDKFIVQILVYDGYGRWDELSSNPVDLHAFAARDIPAVSTLDLFHTATYIDGQKHFVARPYYVSTADIWGARGQVSIRFNDAGLIGHKLNDPIIRP